MVNPQLSSLYEKLNINVGEQPCISVGPYTINANTYLVFYLIFGLLEVLLGAKLLFKPKEIYFKIGVTILVILLTLWSLWIISRFMPINVNPPGLMQ